MPSFANFAYNAFAGMKTILRLLFLFPVVSSLAQPPASNQPKGIPPVPVNAVQPAQAPAFDPSKPSQPVQPGGQVANAPKSATTDGIDFQPEKEKTPAEIARAAFPSVVLIATQDARGQPLSLGSGFFVEKNVIATNFHVIEDAAAGYAKIIGRPTKLKIEGVVGLDAAHDLALLQVSAPAATTSAPNAFSDLIPPAPSLATAPQNSLSVGDPVYAIGNPRGLEGTFSQGIISSVREFGSDRLLQITAPLSPGSSGGPVLDRNGAVIGVSVASITNGQNLNFAVPADYVRQLASKKTELRPFKSIPQVKVSKTLLGQLGHESAREGVTGENLTYDTSYRGGEFSFSLHNTLSESVANVYGLIIFYDLRGQPLDVYPIQYTGVIPAGLARRVTARVDESVEKLNCPVAPGDYQSLSQPRPPKGRVEFRILDFTVADE